MLKSSAAYIWYQRTLVKVSTGKTVWTQIRPDLDLHFLSKKASSSKAILLLWIIYVISVMFLLCFRAGLFIDALKSPAGKGLPSWLSLWCLILKLSLSHYYAGSGVVLDCIASWSLPSFLLLKHFSRWQKQMAFVCGLCLSRGAQNGNL